MKVLKFLKSVGIDLLKTIGQVVLVILAIGGFTKIFMITSKSMPTYIVDKVGGAIVVLILVGCILIMLCELVGCLINYFKRKWSEVE